MKVSPTIPGGALELINVSAVTTWTVPTGEVHEVYPGRITITTDANVANRESQVAMVSAAGGDIVIVLSRLVTPANTTEIAAWGRELQDAEDVANHAILTGPLYLVAPMQLAFTVGSIQAGDTVTCRYMRRVWKVRGVGDAF